MSKKKEPTIRVIWLGQALRDIRDTAGLKQKDAGAHLGRDGSSITRMESGEIPVSEEILDKWMEMCGITDPHKRADLETIRRDAAQSGWWDGYGGDVAPDLMDRAWMESKATNINAFDITYLPGLLQTPEYAEAVMRKADPDTPDAEIARWMEVRMTRQHILTRYHPTPFHCVIDECLLTRQAGGPEIMRAQLNHLIDTSKRDHIEIRILPGGAYQGNSGSFEVFDLEPPYPHVGHVATPVGDLCVEGTKVDKLVRAYDRLKNASLNPKASRALIIAERDKL